MARLAAMALILMAAIAGFLVVFGLPRAPGRAAPPPVAAPVPAPAPDAARIAAEAVLHSIRTDTANRQDEMERLTRHAVRELRAAIPDPGSRLQALAHLAAGAMPADAHVAALRADLPPPAPPSLEGVKPTGAATDLPPVLSLPRGDPPLPRLRPETPRHRVQTGETLSMIAAQVYGRASAWEVIYQANRDRLERPDFLPEGVLLLLPRLP